LPREFFYVDMPVVKVYLRENLKISAIWRVHVSRLWVQTKK
jgi:hypothetical protein